MLFNADLFFNSGTGYGWSERYFIDDSDQDAAMTDLNTLFDPRLSLLPTTMTMPFARVSTPGSPRDSILTALEGSAANGTYVIVSGQTVLPVDNAVLMEFYSSPTLKNRKFFRGMVSQDIAEDTFNPTSTWSTHFIDYQNALEATTFQCASAYHPIPAPAQTFAAIDSVDYVIQITRRKAGRPFGLRRGRVRTSH